MVKQWIRTNGKLWNLSRMSDIEEPIFIGGTPGYWQISYSVQKNNVETINFWTFVTEHEARQTFSKIEKILTSTANFVE